MNPAQIGDLLLAFASIATVGSIVAIGTGSKGGSSARTVGHILTFVTTGFLTLAVTLLAVAFLTENWSLWYVIQNHPTLTGSWAWLYRLSGVWAGREGSLLFWAWVLSLYGAYISYKFMKNEDRVGSVGLAVLNFVQLFFLAALFVEQNNPFVAVVAGEVFIHPISGQSWGVLVDASGTLLTSMSMNPLLETWAMVLHPPTLFIGYAGLAVPFAFALASLITGDVSKRWVQLTDRITVFSWLLLGIGIGLGSVWAYYELAFGGYWAWDPVENASLLPWLTGVGLVHSMTVYRRRGGFKAWTMMMAAFTFVFVLLGTFITRSGIVQSVHAFNEDSLSFWLFLSMMVGSLLAMGIGVLVRWKDLRSDGDGFERIISKEGSYYFNNVIMLIAGVLVAYMTMASAFPSWMPLGGKTIPASSYDALARPLGIFYILVMTACPILAWGGGDWKKLWERGKMPIIIGSVLAAGFVAIYVYGMLPFYDSAALAYRNTPPWWHHFLAISGIVVAGYAIGLPTWLFIDGARKRASATGTSALSALGWIVMRARTQSGGYLTHIGMGVILLGLVGSTMFVLSDQNASVALLEDDPTATYEIAGYEITYRDLYPVEKNVPVDADGNKGVGDTYTILELEVKAPDGSTRIAEPQIRETRSGQTTSHVAIVSEPLKDIFISLDGYDANAAYFTVKFFPLQWWVWVGFGITIIGSGLAAWPKRQLQAAA